MNIQYYLIHGVDKKRGPRMKEEFRKWNLDDKNIKWVLEPNKDEITDDFRSKVLFQEKSFNGGFYIEPGCPNIKNGQIACTYKHYLCLQDIVNNGSEYGVIMEDNQYFCGDIPCHVNMYINQLNKYYPEWDILFDSKWMSYQSIEEEQVIEGKYVYPKSNQIGRFVHGGTRLAQFYILTNKCAKKMYDNYIPFNHSPDWWMNELFRKLDIKAFWSEPCISDVFPHESTVY